MDNSCYTSSTKYDNRWSKNLKQFINISDPSSPAEIYSNFLTYLQYLHELASGVKCDMAYYETGMLHKAPQDFARINITSISNEDLKSLLKSFQFDSLEPYFSIPVADSPKITQITYSNSFDVMGMATSLKDYPEHLHIPIFEHKAYTQIKESLAKNALSKMVLFSIYRNFKDLVSFAIYTNAILGINEQLVRNTSTVIGWLLNKGELDFNITRTQPIEGYYCDNVEARPSFVGSFKNIGKIKTAGSITESPIYTFLVPSYGKSCGIGDYHNHQRVAINKQSSDNPVCVTHRNINDIIFLNNTVFIHHEFLLFHDSYLSENNHYELIDLIESYSKITFPIFFHTLPLWDKIMNDARLNYINELLALKNVMPIVFNKEMYNSIYTYPSMIKSRKKTIVTDLGVYDHIKPEPGQVNGRVLLLGFNNPGKGYQEVVDHLLQNTTEKLLIIGKGAGLVKFSDPNRVWIIDQYMEEEEMLKTIRDNVKVIVCNRSPSSTSSSASYRFAMSTGLPVVASASIAHSSLRDFTGMQGLEYFTSMEEMVQMINDIDQEVALAISEDLVKNWNLGRTTLEVLKTFV